MTTRTIGIAAMIVGLFLLLYTGFNYVTKERVVDLGPIKIDKEKTHFVSWPPIIGVIILAGGVVILLKNNKA